MVQSNTMADSLVDVLGIGRQVVQASDIKSTEIMQQISEYNTSFTEMTRQINERRGLKRRLDEVGKTVGKNSAEAEQIKAEMASMVAPLEQLQATTQKHREWLEGLTFKVVTQADGNPAIYTERDLPPQLAGQASSYRLRYGNDVIDLSAITIVNTAPVHVWRWVVGIIIASLVAFVIIGGIKRIGNVASLLVPFMSVVYCLSALAVLLIHSDKILPAFESIFYHAFNPPAVVGGSVAGATFWMTFAWGLRRGLFSNEAGQGSAAMAHSTAKVEEPVREGLVAMLGPFIDTIVICTMTALVIISTGVWDSGLNGAPLTMFAFNTALPVYGEWMVVIGVALFAFSTILAWSYYGEKGAEYILGSGFKLPYKWIFVVFTLLGARFDLEAVWSYADTANGLMAVPNLIALIVLSGVVVKYTKKYMDEKARGLHKPFKK
jgi:amino acid carrier protein